MPLPAYMSSCFFGIGSVKDRLNAISSRQSMHTSPAMPFPRMRRAWSSAATPPTSIFFGSQPRSAHVPPKGRKSTIATIHPALRTRIAATIAAVPVPMMTRSYRFIAFSCTSRRPSRSELATAGALRLHRRAFDRAEGAEHAAVARIRPEQRAAARAFVVELAGVGRHRLGLGEAALRAGQHRFEDRRAHCFGVDG